MKNLHIKLSEALKNKTKKKAESLGLTISAYIRMLLSKQPEKENE